MAVSERPRTRGECTHARPCPFVTCRHHLFLDVTPEGRLRVHPRYAEPGDMPAEESCVLDVVEHLERDGEDDGLTNEEIGMLLGFTRERVRQVGNDALLKLRRNKDDNF